MNLSFRNHWIFIHSISHDYQIQTILCWLYAESICCLLFRLLGKTRWTRQDRIGIQTWHFFMWTYYGLKFRFIWNCCEWIVWMNRHLINCFEKHILKFKGNLTCSILNRFSLYWLRWIWIYFEKFNIPQYTDERGRPKRSEFFTTHWHTASKHSQTYPSDCMKEGSHTKYAYACQFKCLQIFLFEDLMWFWIAVNWKEVECWGGEHNRKIQKFHNIRFYDCHTHTYLYICIQLFVHYASIWCIMRYGTNNITINGMYMYFTLFYLICIVMTINPFSFPIV